MTPGGIRLMKYENVDIFTFNSHKPKKEPAPANSGTEEKCRFKEIPDEIRKESLAEIRKESLAEPRKESLAEISPENKNTSKTADSVEDAPDLVASNQVTYILTPDTEEILQASSSDNLSKDCQNDLSDHILKTESNIESDVLSSPAESIFKSSSLPKTTPVSKNASLSISDLSLESEVLGSSGKEDFPFEGFAGCDDNTLKASPVSEAFGIVTTGIEPLELTPSGAVITGYITSARRDEIRLGTYVVVPYENGEKLFARVGKLQYRQEFVVDDATEIHSRRMLSARGNPVNEDDYKFLACLDPLCILYRKAEGKLTRRMADRIPHPNTPILPVTDRLEVQTGLNIPENGIFIGHLSVGASF